MNFEQIVESFYEPLHRFALSLTRRHHDAWDLTQQTFYIWATNGHQLRDTTKTRAWLFTTCHRQFLASCRREDRFPHFDVDLVHDELPVIETGTVDQMDAVTLVEMLHALDETYRAPLALFYLEDLSYQEIGEVLEIPPGTVMSRLSRGKEQLRRQLAAHSAAGERKIISMTAKRAEAEEGHG